MIVVGSKSIGLIKIFPVSAFLLILTAVDVPIPTERLDLTSKSIWSPTVKLWVNAVEIETVEMIFCVFAKTCSNLVSIL